MAEAQAYGAPVIAFRRGSVPEVVRDGVSGYIVSGVEEALGALERVPRLCRESCAAWAREHFSAARMVEGYERVYAALLEEHA